MKCDVVAGTKVELTHSRRFQNMLQRKIFAVGATALVLGAIALVENQAGADEAVNWTLTGCEGGKVTSGGKCNLKNQGNQRCLVRDSNRGQTDWNFGNCSGQQVTLVTKSGAAPKCGDTVALKIGNEFFRKCVSPQLVGINICSEAASSPQERIGGTNATHWDWQIKGCAEGTPLDQDKPFALHNISKNDSVVFAKRPSKVADTCWASKMKFGQCTTIRDK
jgi:hypothetical protein